MKKINYVLFILITMLFIPIVNAEVKTVNGVNYVVNNGISCSNVDITYFLGISKTNKILFSKVDDATGEEEIYSWQYDGTCIKATLQDRLDYANTPMNDKFIDMDEDYYSIVDNKTLPFVLMLIKAKKFETGVDYYKNVDNNIVKVENPIEAEIDSYYEYLYFKSPDVAEINPNTTYYEFSTMIGTNSIYAEVENPTIENILDYVVETSKDEVVFENILKKISTSDVDNVIAGKENYIENAFLMNGSEYYINDTFYIVMNYVDENDKYVTTRWFTLDGKEETKYRDLLGIVQLKNYYITFKYDSNENEVGYLYDNKFSLISKIDGTTQSIFYERNKDAFSYGMNNSVSLVKSYYVLDGDKQVFDGNDLTIKFNGERILFDSLKINGTVVDPKNYTVKDGSTVITLKKEYLKELKSGNYTVRVSYKDGGFVDATFAIETTDKSIKNPNTLDNIATYICMFIVSLISISLIGFYLRRNN